MNRLEMMRLADNQDEDAVEYDELIAQEVDSKEMTAEEFKRKYKEFYTDIKIDLHEDW